MARLAVLMVVLAALLAACAGGEADQAAGPPDAEAPAEAPEAGVGFDESGEEVDLAQLAAAERDIVYTAEITVRVDDVAARAAELEELARDAGGFILSSEISGEQRQRATVALRVPPDGFVRVLDAVRDLGQVTAEHVAAEDVTAEVVDLESRIASARTSIDRLRELLSESGNLNDVVLLEGELARRESDLEATLGRLRVLRDQVDLATITVNLGQPGDPQVAENLPGFLGGLRQGVVAFVNVVQVLLTVLGFLLPFLVVGGAVAAAIVWLVRRRRARRPAAQPPQAPQPPHGPQPPYGVPPAPQALQGPPAEPR